MRDPKKIFTKDGFKKYEASLVNLQDSAFYIYNHADDLLLDEEVVKIMCAVMGVSCSLLARDTFEEKSENE